MSLFAISGGLLLTEVVGAPKNLTKQMRPGPGGGCQLFVYQVC